MILSGVVFGFLVHFSSLLRFFCDGHASSTTIEVCEAGADPEISKETSSSPAFFFGGIAKTREGDERKKLDPF